MSAPSGRRRELRRAHSRYRLADRLFLGASVAGVVFLFVDRRLGLVVLVALVPLLFRWKEHELRRALVTGAVADGTRRMSLGDSAREGPKEPVDAVRVPTSPASPAPSTGGPSSGDHRVASSPLGAYAAQPGSRQMRFPTHMSVGTLYTRTPEDTWHGSDDFWTNNIGDARGTMRISADVQVRLWASQRHDDGKYRSPTDLTALRGYDLGCLDSLYVAVPTAEHLRFIPHVEGLRELILDQPSDDGVLSGAKLATLTQLRGFHVTHCDVTDLSIEPLVRSYERLGYLFLSGTGIGDATLRAAAELEGLRALRADSTKVTDEGILALSELSGLDELDLGGTQATDTGIAGLAALTSMRHLNLGSTRITDDGLGFLARMHDLRSLWLDGTDITGSALSAAPLAKLEVLDLSSTVVAPSALAAIGRLPNLVSLALRSTQLPPGATRHLHDMARLRRLSITDVGITPAELLALLEALPNLCDLWVGGTPASIKSIHKMKERLRQAPSGATHLRRKPQPPPATRELPWPGTWSAWPSHRRLAEATYGA